MNFNMFLNRFFTLNGDDSGAWLVVLRMGASLILMVKLVNESVTLDLLYGSKGLVPIDISVCSQLPFIPGLFGLWQVLKAFMTESLFLKLFFLGQFIAAFFLFIGWRTRIAAIACWGMQVVVFNSTHLTSYGLDAVLLSLLFYSMLFPTGRVFSLDNPKQSDQKAAEREVFFLYQKTLQLHLCIIYFVTGICKLHGQSWYSGDGLWEAINQPQFHSMLSPLLKPIFLTGKISAFLGTTAVALEVVYAFLIWVRGLNRWILLLTIGLHLFIAVVMGLWLFAALMIIFNLAAFGCIFHRKAMSE